MVVAGDIAVPLPMLAPCRAIEVMQSHGCDAEPMQASLVETSRKGKRKKKFVPEGAEKGKEEKRGRSGWKQPQVTLTDFTGAEMAGAMLCVVTGTHQESPVVTSNFTAQDPSPVSEREGELQADPKLLRAQPHQSTLVRASF